MNLGLEDSRAKIVLATLLLAGAVLGFYSLTSSQGLESYNEADVEFLREMAVHHDQALVMAEIGFESTDNSELLEFLEKVEETQSSEHGKMHRWLSQVNAEEEPENLSQVPGLLSEEKIQRLNESTGREFDLLFLEYMIEHHRGAITMSEEVIEEGESRKVEKLAENIIRVQEEEIDQMQAWQSEWNQSE
jgi:uncharacterized protein (DUF305 family)